MIYLLYTIHVIVCVFLILVVLLQQGKGADLSVFGGGSTQTAFGARGATTLLHKLTVISFLVFIMTTLLIGVPRFQGGSVVGDLPVEGETQLPNPVENEQGPLTPGDDTLPGVEDAPEASASPEPPAPGDSQPQPDQP